MATTAGGRSLEATPTWAVATVCFVLVAISIVIEHLINLLGKWFEKRHKKALREAVEKIKAELMLLGFISLLLVVFQGKISEICVSNSVGATWHPCDKPEDAGKAKSSSGAIYVDKCVAKGKVAFVSKDGIHQLHIFIFVLALFHVLYSIMTLLLGKAKMRKWKIWEDETKTIEYQYHNDPERFRFARDTSFGQRHLQFWSRSPILLWIVCFFRQFFKSVDKVDYLTLRHGFILAHFAPRSASKFDFQKYISRSLDEDFTLVVGISPIIWLVAILLLLSNTHGWESYAWVPFIPLIIILLVGAKLEMIITQMGVRIQERGDIVKGAPVVQPGDDLFWFRRPRFLLFLIHFVLFQNAFQLAFFAWSAYEFGWKSCFHKTVADIVIRVTMGVIIQVLCSYVTLPLYALVTQMGSTMRPTIFNEHVAAALKNWRQEAKKNTRSRSPSPFSASPLHGMSPVHLLHKFRHNNAESAQTSPRNSDFDNPHFHDDAPQWASYHEGEGLQPNRQYELELESQQPANLAQVDPSAESDQPVPQHEIDMSSSGFSFGNKK